MIDGRQAHKLPTDHPLGVEQREDGAARPIEGGHYGAGFLAHIAVTKCADATPLHRLAKQYQRLGIPMSRSTLTDLFHKTAEKLAPISQRLLQLVRDSEIVQADETSSASSYARAI